MRLPPHRYPDYYSLRRMLVESVLANRASGAVVKIVTGAKQRGPRRDHWNPPPVPVANRSGTPSQAGVGVRMQERMNPGM